MDARLNMSGMTLSFPSSLPVVSRDPSCPVVFHPVAQMAKPQWYRMDPRKIRKNHQLQATNDAGTMHIGSQDIRNNH